MIAGMDISITRAEKSKLQKLELKDLPFGHYFSDHMLEADFKNGEWGNIGIRPYQALPLEPSLIALHYGQAIFEGLKAYRDEKGNPYIFRPHDNFTRFNISAQRMQMPTVPEFLFIEGLKRLIEVDKNWIPTYKDHSLYIRPFMFATDEMIGVRPSETYKFLTILSPTGPYYVAPMRIYVEEKYVRAAPGGVGYAKAAGNYAAAMMATAEAKEKGYDQVLWTDANQHKYVQEIGTMNVFFIIGDKAITPDLAEGTILNGVNRMTAITLMQEMGLSVEERPLGIDEIIDAYKAGTLREVFGTGTAAIVIMIKELRYKDFVMKFDVDTWKTAPTIRKWVTDIREFRREDKYGWMVSVSTG